SFATRPSHRFAADPDGARCVINEPRQNLEQCCLTAAGWTNDADEFAWSDGQRQVLERNDTAAVLTRVGLADVLNFDQRAWIYQLLFLIIVVAAVETSRYE